MRETATVLVVHETVQFQVYIHDVEDSLILTNPPSGSGHVPPGSVQDWRLRRFFPGGGRCSLL